MGLIRRVFSILLAFFGVMSAGGNSDPVIYKSVEPYLMLSAHTSNWGEACIGDWGGTSWEIYSDGSYEMTVHYIQDRGEVYEPDVYTGFMTQSQFARLLNACDCVWMDPRVDSDACDGQGWSIDMFDADGNVIHTTGKLGYIYGQINVETIISLLPRPDWDGSKSVQKKEATREYFQTVNETTTYEDIVRAIGPEDSKTGSGIPTLHWNLDDGSVARVTFYVDHVMTAVIVMDGEISEIAFWPDE